MSDSLLPHGLQHTKLPCPSPIPGACSNSSPLSWWCHPTNASSVIPLSSRLQYFPVSGSFPMRQFFPKYRRFSPSNEYSGLISFMMDWFDVFQSKGLSRVFSNTTVQKNQLFSTQVSLLRHPYMTTGKNIALTRWTVVGKVISLLFNMLSRFVITLFPRSKYLLISWQQLPFTVILELKK